MRRLIIGVLFLPLLLALWVVAVGISKIVLGLDEGFGDGFSELTAFGVTYSELMFVPAFVVTCVTSWLLHWKPRGQFTFHWLCIFGISLLCLACFETKRMNFWGEYSAIWDVCYIGTTLITGVTFAAAAVIHDLGKTSVRP